MFGDRRKELELDNACKAIEMRLKYEETGNELYKILADGYQKLSGREQSVCQKRNQ